VAALVDEVVVVDTGSTDGTVAVARAHGATVLETEWHDDFSAPRNLALGAARGRWILSIDADERVAPTIARRPLEELLAVDEVAAYMVLLRPARGYTPYRECRLFRNLPGARFEGRIHERVLPSLAGRGAVGRCPLLIEHAGYEGPRDAKARRDLPLLLAHVDACPGDLDQWRRLAEAAAACGDAALARRAYKTAVALVRAGDDAGPPAALTYSGFAQLLFAAGEDVDALLAEGLERFPGNQLLVWLRARVEEARGDDEAAVEWFRRLTSVDAGRLPEEGISYDARLFDAVAHAGIAGGLFRLGRYAESADAYARAAAAAPDDLEIRAKSALAAARARGSAVAA
jgi:glycosyltransferase involved in cell wall biosynthesis